MDTIRCLPYGLFLAAMFWRASGAMAQDDLEQRHEAILSQDELIEGGAPLVPSVPARQLNYRVDDQSRRVTEPVRWRRYFGGPTYRYYYGPGPRYYRGYYGPPYYNGYYYGRPRYYAPYRYRVGVGPLRVYWR